MMYPLSLFFWYILLESMMVGDFFLIVQLNDSVEHNLQEWIQLGEYQPNIHHPHIGSGWKFCHHTKIKMKLGKNKITLKLVNSFLLCSIVSSVYILHV